MSFRKKVTNPPTTFHVGLDRWNREVANGLNTFPNMSVTSTSQGPEGVIDGVPNTLYFDDGSSVTKLWLKHSGVTSSGWTPVPIGASAVTTPMSWELIQAQNLSADSKSIIFSNITAVYRGLRLTMGGVMGTALGSGETAQMRLTLNGSATSYWGVVQIVEAGGTSVVGTTSGTSLPFLRSTGPHEWQPFNIQVDLSATSNFNRVIRSHVAFSSASVAALASNTNLTSGQWRSPSAITEVRIFSDITITQNSYAVLEGYR